MVEEAQHIEPRPLDEEPKISLLDILIILARGKWIWLGSAVVFGMLAVGLGYILPEQYKAETVILPPQQAMSSASLLAGQVGNLLGMGASSGLGMKDPNDVLLAILRSHTVADVVINRFDLKRVYKKADIFAAEHELTKHSTIETTLQGTISIKVEDRDPKRAAGLANAYVDALYKQNERFAFTEAAQRRVFFQSQIDNEKNRLEDAEVGLKETELKTGVIEIQSQTALALRRVADLRAQITSNQVQLQTLLSSETSNNPDVVRLQEQIRSLQDNLAKIEAPGSNGTESVNLPTSAVPEATLDYVRKLREVKYHEELFSLLTRQLEAARIDESKEAPAVQVIDVAVPPPSPSSPRRMLITAAGLGLGLILGWIYTISAAMTRKSLGDPESVAKLWSLRQALFG
jgi:tyrosine-protein kinase Etk/Wzc